MIKIFVFSILLLSVYAATGTTTGNRAVKASQCVKVEAANIISTGAAAGKCLSTPTAAGGTSACCFAEWAAAPKMVHGTQAANSPDVTIAAGGTLYGATAGGFDGTDSFCFTAGGDASFTSPANAYQAATNVWFDMTAHCGAAGATPALPTGGLVNYWHSSATNDGSVTGTNVAFNDAASAANSARKGVVFAAKPTTCKCGTSSIPSDNCAALASTNLNTVCMTKSDSQSPAQKCCLATFDAVPTTAKSSGTRPSITAGTKGGLVSSDATPKYYACYQNKADGYFRFKTGAGGTIDAKEAATKFTTFCATGAVTKEQTAAYVYDVDVAVASATTTSGITGTAASCQCGTASIFNIGFVLLAILANLWK